MQWHPLFAELLRPLLQQHYQVETNVPVGDAPRLADILLVRRTSATPPFVGLWRWLTTWNVLEFKGPTVSARVDDLDGLLEVGLGIHRRLHEEQARQRQPLVKRAEVSFWYLANHLGRRFLRAAESRIGALTPVAEGLWRVAVWQRAFFLVSNRALAVEPDSLPVHLLTVEEPDTQEAVAEVLRRHPRLVPLYATWLGIAHPDVLKEVSPHGTEENRGRVLPVRPAGGAPGLAGDCAPDRAEEPDRSGRSQAHHRRGRRGSPRGGVDAGTARGTAAAPATTGAAAGTGAQEIAGAAPGRRWLRAAERVTIDTNAQKLEAAPNDGELGQRRAAWAKPPLRVERGVLAKYADSALGVGRRGDELSRQHGLPWSGGMAR
jgi:hypothetical protein